MTTDDDRARMKEWLDKQEFLPPELRDHHAQKDVFKRVQQMVEAKRSSESASVYDRDLPNWISAHIYTVDFFLWFMAMHGYTLQRARTRKLVFYDLAATIAAFKEEQTQALRRMMSENVVAPIQPPAAFEPDPDNGGDGFEIDPAADDAACAASEAIDQRARAAIDAETESVMATLLDAETEELPHPHGCDRLHGYCACGARH